MVEVSWHAYGGYDVLMGVSAKSYHELAPSTRAVYDSMRKREISPRLRAAHRLYSSGAVPSKRAAAEAVGLHPQYYYLMSSPQVGNPGLRLLRDEIDEAIQDKTIDMSRVLTMIGRKAIQSLYEIMQMSDSEGLRLKAAQDLADRSPETSKTIKHAVANINISGADARDIAAALVSSAKAREEFAHVAEGDFVRVDMKDDTEATQIPSGNGDSARSPES